MNGFERGWRFRRPRTKDGSIFIELSSNMGELQREPLANDRIMSGSVNKSLGREIFVYFIPCL